MDYKQEFIELMIRSGVLRFGDFTTKSGRKTPYFINTGNFKTGRQLLELGRFYAACYHHHLGALQSVLFGPAYKGIPLVAVTATALAQHYGVDVPICFNRKEKKDHGEGGVLVGQAPKPGDTVVVIEDVITAGTSVRETMELFRPMEGVKIGALIIAADRMERGAGSLSTLEELRREFGIGVYPIVNIREILEYMHNREIDGKIVIDDAMRERILEHLAQYGA